MKDKVSPFQGILQATNPEFFQEIATLEALLCFDCTLELIKNLTNLYTEAIEHFESLRDPNYIIYTDKLHKLLHRSEVKSILFVPSEPAPEPKRSQRNELSCERVIAKTFQNLQTENLLITEKIHENLKQQTSSLPHKLKSRKTKASQKAKLKAIEEGMEEIIEGFVQEKGKTIKEVQAKYSDSLKELKNMKQNDVVRKVLEEIERQMNDEVTQKVEEIENYKNMQVKSLKQKVQLQIG